MRPTRSKMTRVAGATIALAVLCGCGGIWVDDPRNFQRVFGFSSKKPAGVQILHSFYSKSPHWTTEYQYFLTLRESGSIRSYHDRQGVGVSGCPSRKALEDCGANGAPSWFLPKPLDRYEMWMPANSDNYRLLRDKDDSTLYMCDLQL